MKLLRKVLLYFSAFVPMYLLILTKFVFGIIGKSIEIDLLSILNLAVYSTLIIAGVIGVIWNTICNKAEFHKIVLTSKQNLTDQHFLGYFSIFVLFALAFELTNLSMFTVSLGIIVFVGIVYINNEMFYINPLLNVLGFNFFEIKYKKVGEEKERSSKMFYRGEPKIGKTYFLKKENSNFSFVQKKLK